MVTDMEQEPMDELETMKEELQRLTKEKQALTEELEARDATIARLEQAIADRDGEVEAMKQSVAEAEEKLTEINNTLSQAVAGYKAMVVSSNPGMLAELITGDTVDEVDESLKSAQALVDRVKQEMEAEVSKTKIPAGAPQRAPVDLSALSPREKIQYAIGGNR